jgi:hypothetical protein
MKDLSETAEYYGFSAREARISPGSSVDEGSCLCGLFFQR